MIHESDPKRLQIEGGGENEAVVAKISSNIQTLNPLLYEQDNYRGFIDSVLFMYLIITKVEESESLLPVDTIFK